MFAGGQAVGLSQRVARGEVAKSGVQYGKIVGELPMPIYEYYCHHCNKEYQLIRPPSQADEPAPCKDCGRPGQRQLTTFSFKSDTFSKPRLGLPTQKPLRPYQRQPQPGPPGDTGLPGQGGR